MSLDGALAATFISSLTIVYTLMIITYALQTMVPLGYSSPVMAVQIGRAHV